MSQLSRGGPVGIVAIYETSSHSRLLALKDIYDGSFNFNNIMF